MLDSQLQLAFAHRKVACAPRDFVRRLRVHCERRAGQEERTFALRTCRSNGARDRSTIQIRRDNRAGRMVDSLSCYEPDVRSGQHTAQLFKHPCSRATSGSANGNRIRGSRWARIGSCRPLNVLSGCAAHRCLLIWARLGCFSIRLGPRATHTGCSQCSASHVSRITQPANSNVLP